MTLPQLYDDVAIRHMTIFATVQMAGVPRVVVWQVHS